MAKIAEENYFRYLKDKKVILVGPANYLIGQNKGEEIDEFDIVIRLNQALPIDIPQDRGKKTNVLYHTLFDRPQIDKNPFTKKKDLISKEDVLYWKNEGVKWLITYEHGLWKKRLRLIKNDLKIAWTAMPVSFINMIKKDANTIPNTGLCAILHVLCADIKSLTIVGCDFHATGVYYFKDIGNFSSMRELSEQWHNTELQIKFLREIYLKDNRLFIDRQMEKILFETG